MDLSTAVLGKSVVTRLRVRQLEALVRLGSDTFTREALAINGCTNYIAAANLSAILNREFRIVDTRDVYSRITPDALAIPKLGAFTLAVLGACFQIKGIGGDRPLESWIRKHRGDHKVVSFDTLKQRDQQAARAEKRTAKTRKTSRRNSAHRLRTDRYLARREKPTHDHQSPTG